MDLIEVDSAALVALEYFKTVLKKEGSIVGVSKSEDGWKVELEVVDYRGAGFDPTLGLYEVVMDKELAVLSYRRTHLRRVSELYWSSLMTE